MTDNGTVVRIQDVTKEYKMGETITMALDGVSLDIPKGELLLILGPSGSGKTTLLNMIAALDSPTTGKIFVEDDEISALSDKQRTVFRAEKIGLVFQFYNLFPALTAKENVEIGLALVIKDPDELTSRSEKYLKMVGIEDHMNKYPSQLSGGEQQRVAVARALAKEPMLLVADEPTGNLDAETGDKIWQLLQQINKKTDTTIIAVTHQAQMSKIADRAIFLRSGKIAQVTPGGE
ncbi:MAG: ABC transporter ATP-binding protein [Methanomassiliicoccales archaeon]|nr:MAG: ABC transporter ATP-binding protein [Methanomassiliicoccales archaeon]